MIRQSCLDCVFLLDSDRFDRSPSKIWCTLPPENQRLAGRWASAELAVYATARDDKPHRTAKRLKILALIRIPNHHMRTAGISDIASPTSKRLRCANPRLETFVFSSGKTFPYHQCLRLSHRTCYVLVRFAAFEPGHQPKACNYVSRLRLVRNSLRPAATVA